MCVFTACDVHGLILLKQRIITSALKKASTSTYKGSLAVILRWALARFPDE